MPNPKLTLLELAHERLGWPNPSSILEPSGAGPSVFARLAKEKLEKNIERLPDGNGVRVGVLMANPDSNDTEPPVAVICEFPRVVSEATLKETHKLAWSFCRSPLLITLEPQILRAWTCCEPPSDSANVFKPVVKEVSSATPDLFGESFLTQQAAESLHWVQLASGQFFQENEKRFKRENCADVLLLENLREVRGRLREKGLSYTIIHDLLARLIFIQFLFQRKDSSGNAALNSEVLEELHQQGKLSTSYPNLPSILLKKEDTYKLFRWLNDKFNGDLFPGIGDTPEEREAEWQREIDKVKQTHLNLLADFVSGELVMESGQRCLWPQYSFDAVPLDFISSIYEEFVKDGEPREGVHYTPGHMVDFVLDNILPWNSPDWDVKILDPACGSGIFLVKAYQRLIHRCKRATAQERLNENVLRGILENNIFGVDIKGEAVRVASFSLYLTMCDEIDPRRYWLDWTFPRLRDRRLIGYDFFGEHIEGFRTVDDENKYDLVIGNAPWGFDSMTPLARVWVQHVQQWPVTNKDIGPLFLAKAAALTKPSGQVSMLQPAGSLLTNQIPTAKKLREKIFTEFKVEEVINLAALRFGLFKDAISPTCIITFRPVPPDGEAFWYRCPKPIYTNENDYRVIIEPHDNNLIHPDEAAYNPWIWSALMWGGRRDLSLIEDLARHPTLEQLEAEGRVVIRRGVSRGNKQKIQESILGKRMLQGRDFPEGTFLFLEAKKLHENTNPYTHSKDSTSMDAFELPQLIIKQGWQKRHKRFQAAIVKSDPKTGGVFSTRSYVSVHSSQSPLALEAACLSLNSKLAVYYLFLTSGRFASYRPEVNEAELLTVPMPKPRIGLLQNLKSYEDIDNKVRQAFSLKESEWILVEDLFNYILPNFKEGKFSEGRKPTRRRVEGKRNEPELRAYCEYFIRVLKAGFGSNKNICATIFQEKTLKHLPIRLVAIHLDWPHRTPVSVERTDYGLLWERLRDLNTLFIEKHSKEAGGIFYQRIARLYGTFSNNGIDVPTVFLIKPDQRSYWSRSIAMRDADEVAAEIMASGILPITTPDTLQEVRYG